MTADSTPLHVPISVRAYTTLSGTKATVSRKRKAPSLGASEWALIFDTETTTDAAQQLRFGCYQVRKADRLIYKGVFYDPMTLSKSETLLMREYANAHGLSFMIAGEFIEQVFFYYVYDLSAVCVGFNLPFDLSRLAVGHSQARGKTMRGGFSFILSENEKRPRLQVKHINTRTSIIQFTIPPQQRTARSRRKLNQEVPPHRGYFVDVKTLACALLSGSWSLKTLAEHLKTEHQKLNTDEHGGSLTAEYLDYAIQDVQVTWECFERLRKQYESYGLSETPITRIYSEAGLGKAYLRQMGVRPWTELQPDFPPELLGIIMSVYYGGRSEVHIRRQVTRVLYCDFLSMYPTVCTLMGLWRFVIAKRMNWQDITSEIQTYLESIRLEDLQKPKLWRQLTTLVQVQAEDDILPIRAKYDGHQFTIGLNHLTSQQPLWYTLADCIASKLLKGRIPKVLRAIRFQPVGTQSKLKPIAIAGDLTYQVDPLKDDFYCRLIDLRSEVKARQKKCSSEDISKLEAEQLALKICANAITYGIFMELNVVEQDKLKGVTCYGPAEQSFSAKVKNTEEPGRYFHPLLAALITGAARLMLALSERLAKDAGITWAFCDTDSMALAPFADMPDAKFLARAQSVQDWFTPLNPYAVKAPLFKIEDANYRVEKGVLTNKLEPLYCYAISAKRYALFNTNASGRPVLRKASAHGLGHLRPPYEERDAPRSIPKPIQSVSKIGVERWQYDLWYRVVLAALNNRPEQVRISDLCSFDQPAVSRYSATTPALLRWLHKYNQDKPYREQVKPFNFLLAFQAHPSQFARMGIVIGESDDKQEARRKRQLKTIDIVRPVTAYDKDHGQAARRCFDRDTGEPIFYERLKTYGEVLAQYHLHPEWKFDNASFTDSGFTNRRHIIATAIEHIGKEANRWEELWHLGDDPEARNIYGISPDDLERVRDVIWLAHQDYKVRELARASRLSVGEVSALLNDRCKPRREPLMKVIAGIEILKAEAIEKEKHLQSVVNAIKQICQQISVRQFAALVGMNNGYLIRILSGVRKPSAVLLAKLESALADCPVV